MGKDSLTKSYGYYIRNDSSAKIAMLLSLSAGKFHLWSNALPGMVVVRVANGKLVALS